MGRLNEQPMGTWRPLDQPIDRRIGRPMSTISSHGTTVWKSHGCPMGPPILYPMGRKSCHGTAHGLAHGTNHGTHDGP